MSIFTHYGSVEILFSSDSLLLLACLEGDPPFFRGFQQSPHYINDSSAHFFQLQITTIHNTERKK